MKKSLFITTLILFFSCIFTVYADNIFKYDWHTEAEYLRSDYTMGYNNNIYFDKGYVTTTINLKDVSNEDIPKNYLRKYNIQGELQTTKILENKMILSLISNNQYIIALAIVYGDTDVYKILLLDNSLNIQKEITINMEEDEEISYIIDEFKILGMKYLNVIDSSVYFYSSDYIKGINLETGKTTNYRPTDENIKKYMNHLYRLDQERTERNDFFGYDTKKNYEVITGMSNQGCIQRPVHKEVGGTVEDSLYSRYSIFSDAFVKPYLSCEPDYKGVIKLYNNNELVFDKQYDEYNLFSTPYIINDYIVTIATKMDYDLYEYNVSLVIFDMKGNIVQEISEEEYYLNLVAGPTSFMTIGANDSGGDRCYSMPASTSYNCLKSKNIVYYLPLTITTEIEGNGKIEVPATARYEELVKYNFFPDNNYSLSSITILDSDNNKITTSDNTFIMPSTNVTLKAKFSITNPETSDIPIIGIVITLLVSIIILIKYSKRLKEK